MKFTTLVPTRFNDGKRVSRRTLQRFMDELTSQFGGCSEEGLTKGQWIDPTDATRYHDQAIRVSVVCDRILLEEAKEAVIKIGTELRHLKDLNAVVVAYFEVHGTARSFLGVTNGQE